VRKNKKKTKPEQNNDKRRRMWSIIKEAGRIETSPFPRTVHASAVRFIELWQLCLPRKFLIFHTQQPADYTVHWVLFVCVVASLHSLGFFFRRLIWKANLYNIDKKKRIFMEVTFDISVQWFYRYIWSCRTISNREGKTQCFTCNVANEPRWWRRYGWSSPNWIQFTMH
jgi:hypothetical protein